MAPLIHDCKVCADVVQGPAIEYPEPTAPVLDTDGAIGYMAIQPVPVDIAGDAGVITDTAYPAWAGYRIVPLQQGCQRRFGLDIRGPAADRIQ